MTSKYPGPIHFGRDVFSYDVFKKANILNDITKVNSFAYNMITNTGYTFIPNETLVWFNIDKFKVSEVDIGQRIIHKKTLKELEPKISQGPVSEVAKFVGSREYLEGLKKGGKRPKTKRSNKSRKNNSRRVRKNKTKGRKGKIIR